MTDLKTCRPTGNQMPSIATTLMRKSTTFEELNPSCLLSYSIFVHFICCLRNCGEHLSNGLTFMPVQCTGICFSFLNFSLLLAKPLSCFFLYDSKQMQVCYLLNPIVKHVVFFCTERCSLAWKYNFCLWHVRWAWQKHACAKIRKPGHKGCYFGSTRNFLCKILHVLQVERWTSGPELSYIKSCMWWRWSSKVLGLCERYVAQQNKNVDYWTIRWIRSWLGQQCCHGKLSFQS